MVETWTVGDAVNDDGSSNDGFGADTDDSKSSWSTGDAINDDG
ncbi:hypothetical protein [Halorussus caseinilyticus]|nr:hypothetical protein [Halorussus sp. DT72]